MGRRGPGLTTFFLFLLLTVFYPSAQGAETGNGGHDQALSLPQGGLLLLLLPEKSHAQYLAIEDHRIALSPWRDKESQGRDHALAALVGVDFARSPGSLPVDIYLQDGRKTRFILQVMPRSFQVSRLHVARSFVTPPESLLRRLNRERKIIHAALASPDTPLRFHRSFILPLAGKVTHDFGAYRYLNGHPMARHSGEDIDVPQGTPVRAANNGIVRLAGSFYYDGNMVILDHGGGLLTEYLHMADIQVRPGQIIHRGEVIGHVGHTGRVTGPVLHYGAVLHGAHVNPMLLTKLLARAVSLGTENR